MCHIDAHDRKYQYRVVDVKIKAKDPHRLVDVYNVAGVVVLKQIRYSEAFTVLPQGFYIIDGEKVIIN